MRISVREGDKGFENYIPGQRAFLDGEEVTWRCFIADEEKGEVYLYKLSTRGQPYYDADKDEIPWEILRGDVRIVMNEFVNGVEIAS